MTAKKSRLPNAKDWRNRPLERWNVTSFTEYLKDKHRDLFGIDYAPMGGRWGLEQGILGDLIGTQSRTSPKPRSASNEAVKNFIDVTFENYLPNAQYPGTSFGFMWTYRKQDWQRIQAEEVKQQLAQERRRTSVEEATDLEELSDWW